MTILRLTLAVLVGAAMTQGTSRAFAQKSFGDQLKDQLKTEIRKQVENQFGGGRDNGNDNGHPPAPGNGHQPRPQPYPYPNPHPGDGHDDGHNHGHPSPGYNIDHNSHVIRDRHGHIIGRYHHNVIHQDSRYIVPHSGQHHLGTYYVRSGRYYYYPQTASSQVRYQPQLVSFGGFSHVDDLALRLETLSNEFCLDLHYNYAHNHGFRETYREAYHLLQVAKYIHDAEHRNDRLAVQRELGGLDQLFHHLEDDVRGWSRHHRRQIGQLGILSKMDLMESTLHHLMNDVGVHATPAYEQAPPPEAIEQAPPPPGGTIPIGARP